MLHQILCIRVLDILCLPSVVLLSTEEHSLPQAFLLELGGVLKTFLHTTHSRLFFPGTGFNKSNPFLALASTVPRFNPKRLHTSDTVIEIPSTSTIRAFTS
jgi:hypothetical protein